MAIEPFATVEQLEQRWRPLTQQEEEQAEALLLDATVLIMSCGVVSDPDDEVQQAALEAVTCAMVRRAMQNDNLGFASGVNSYMQTAGPYTEQVTLSNPNEDLFLTRQEKAMLGISATKIGAVRPAIHDRAGDPIDNW